ncbi:3-deoxy-8-phosphooctulonate synthase [Helicobacter monodelphidis]|uniref:3-deoxy-8-phosphooctulonate synthase n=1 Tax=Helicobacter sp. 15-1451 TaxID=2004995 RepID=UPI000DCDDE07|nr:3-deoxy-8-phosphooctulonate synthase [Helicobacter sp. 15-1451]RAX59264.1 3-deoxy-8-phosphooctulonate synthase [Helicobacter sp. 15-1451]
MILIAGPCVIENKDILFEVAESLSPLASHQDIEFYFKSSFDKANRTSLESYRGPGLEKGLELLAEVKKHFGYKILTDVHECYQVKPAAEIADVLQIPAFLCRQTDLIVEVAKSGVIVNIKKGQFMNPADMEYSTLKALKTKKPSLQVPVFEDSKHLGVWLTERGSSFGYGNLVVDMRSLLIMREFAPVIFDATHSVQMPGAAKGKSGGNSNFVAPLSRAAVAIGVDGFFMETHPRPSEALSDGANMITPQDLQELVETLLKVQRSLH